MNAQSVLGAGSTYENSYAFQLIEQNVVTPYVVGTNVDFQKFENIVEAVNKGRIITAQTDNGSRLMKLPYLPPNIVSATVKTRTSISGTVLRLDFNESLYDGFVNYQMVMASNKTRGQVKDHGAGFVVLELLYSITGDTTFQSADFIAGSAFAGRQDVSPGVTEGRENTTQTPLLNYNVIGQQRYSFEVTRENYSRRTAVVVNGQPYWQHAGYDLWMRDKKSIMNVGTWDSPMVNVQDKWVSGGIEWQIENQGGEVLGYQGDLYDLMLTVAKTAKAKGLDVEEYFVPVGYEAFANFQTSIANNTNLKYAGTSNTFGGSEVKGINAKVFSCLDIDFKLSSWPLFNNSQINPTGVSTLTGKSKSAYNAVFIDTRDVYTVGYGKQPFASNYKYGADAHNMSIVEGITDLMGKSVKKGTNTTNSASVQLEVNLMTQLNDPTRHFIGKISS